MLKAIHCDTQDHVFRHLTSLEQARDVKNLPNALLWLDLQSPSEQELVKLGQEFALHPLAIEDASREHQRAKVEEYEHFYFVVFYSVSLEANAAELDICELDMFLGKNYLITVHNGHIHELDEVEQRWTRNVNQLEWGVGVLLYTLLDSIVDRYFPVVDREGHVHPGLSGAESGTAGTAEQVGGLRPVDVSGWCRGGWPQH